MKNSKIFIIFFIVFFFGLGSGFSILNEKLSSNNLEINKMGEKVSLVFDESLSSLRDFGLKIQSIFYKIQHFVLSTQILY
ncbi:MAG: hypothetical protein PHX25_00150 [Candidatus Pacebacteria bacterium]|nr:hypothetical protein [Candidatus Paceibacterota bacterium]